MKLKDIERATLLAANLQQAEEALQSFTGRNRPYNCSEIRGQVLVAFGGDYDTKELAQFAVSKGELKALLEGRIGKLKHDLSQLGVDVGGLPAPTVQPTAPGWIDPEHRDSSRKAGFDEPGV